ncbi:MAG TPA: chemotaxis protein CheB [Mycobacteriales bacterium]|nr:chemotaxis protein CheB [Mycobacteriales bacterium]
MTTDLVVIGGSWGGFEAVCHLLGALPGEISAPIVVALHRSPKSSNDALERMIRDCTRLDVVGVEDKRPLHDACIYVAPPDYHLLVEDGSLALSTDDVVQYSRPSIDVLFESAADEYGAGVVGVLLTGANADGASGIRRIKARGGMTMAQDPATAARAEMPRAAVETGMVDFVADLDGLAARLAEIVDPAAPVDARDPAARGVHR